MPDTLDPVSGIEVKECVVIGPERPPNVAVMYYGRLVRRKCLSIFNAVSSDRLQGPR